MITGLGWYRLDEALTSGEDSRDAEMSVPTLAELPQVIRELETQCARDQRSFVWLGISEPTPDEMAAITSLFDLDPLLVEDASNAQQRAKFQFGDDGQVFALLKELAYTDGDGPASVETGQVAIFVGDWFAVSVRYGDVKMLAEVRARITRSPELRSHGPFGVLYAVIDAAVDAYGEVSDDLTEDVADLETKVFEGTPAAGVPGDIYHLKRENQEIRRAVTPLVAPAHLFINHEYDVIPEGLRRFFSDIGEHILRVSDSVDSVDNLLLSLLMANTALQDFQQNRDMRKISAWVAIGVVPTAIAAIYGMNFDDMPELHSPLGYPIVLLVMLASCIGLFIGFKRSKWL